MKRFLLILTAMIVILIGIGALYVLQHLPPSEAVSHPVFTPSEELLHQPWDGGQSLAKDLFSQYLELGKKGKLETSRGAIGGSWNLYLSNYDKIDDYKINEVTNARVEENKLKFSVSYDVKPKGENSDWIAGNGVGGEDGWIIRKSAFVEFENLDDGTYRFISSNTGP